AAGAASAHSSQALLTTRAGALPMRGFSRDQAHLRGERAGGQPATEKRNEAWLTEPSQKAPAFKHGDEWRVLIWGLGTGVSGFALSKKKTRVACQKTRRDLRDTPNA